MSISVRRLFELGPADAARAVTRRALRPLHLARTKAAPVYVAPTAADLGAIEAGLEALGVHCADLHLDAAAFDRFCRKVAFPIDYHGGPSGGVYAEKLLEHFVAWEQLELEHDASRCPYVDVAGAASPWAKLLRDQGRDAWSIDLAPHPSFAGLPYYLQGDATASPFGPATVGSASLQCAFEMFAGDADTRLVVELARVLKPGGRAVICPLYMHTQPCYYQSPEHYGRANGDAGARRYLRRGVWNVPTSRKYSPQTLLERVWAPALAAGLRPGLLVLRNGAALGPGIYLHFVLTLDKPT